MNNSGARIEVRFLKMHHKWYKKKKKTEENTSKCLLWNNIPLTGKPVERVYSTFPHPNSKGHV